LISIYHPYFHAKVRLSEDNTKRKNFFLFLLSSVSTFGEANVSESRIQYKIKSSIFIFIVEAYPKFGEANVRLSEHNTKQKA